MRTSEKNDTRGLGFYICIYLSRFVDWVLMCSLSGSREVLSLRIRQYLYYKVGYLPRKRFISKRRMSCAFVPVLGPLASFFFRVRIRLGTILGRFSIIYFRGLGLRIRIRVRVRVRVSVVLWSG